MGSRFATFRTWTKTWFGAPTRRKPATASRAARMDPTGFVQLEDRITPATFIVTGPTI